MSEEKENKRPTPGFREMGILVKLLAHRTIKATDLMDEYGIKDKTIQRDIEKLKDFFSEQVGSQEIIIDGMGKNRTYRMSGKSSVISKQQMLIIIKILMASRSLKAVEMQETIDNLLEFLSDEDRNATLKILKYKQDQKDSFQMQYQSISKETELTTRIWALSQHAVDGRTLCITYKHGDGSVTCENIVPQTVLFSEYYFYVVAVSDAPYINSAGHIYYYRIDRITEMRNTTKHVDTTHTNRFTDNPQNRDIFFMRQGSEKTVEIDYTGNPKIVEDRFSDVKLVKPITATDGNQIGNRLKFKSYSDAAVMWILSQGSHVTAIHTASIKKQVQAELTKMVENLNQ